MKKEFSSKLGIVLSAVGSAVGMANIWGFPYKFQAGGLVFLIFYILFASIFSYVGLSSEFAVGRLAQTGTLGAYEYAYESRKNNSKLGRYIGFIPLIGTFLIAVGYCVIVAYILKGFVDSLTGQIFAMDAEIWFNSFAMENYSVITYHAIAILLTIITCLGGASSIEKSNKIMMPAFFILFVVLAIKVATLPNASAGYANMFKYNPETLNINTIVTAMGQAFFSLSITGSGMIVVGAYISKKEDIVSSSVHTGILDTLSGLIASFVIIPAVSVFNMQQVGGPSLLFVTLPTILKNVRFGRIFAIFLYFAVICAGISSLQNMFEVITESITARFKNLSRRSVFLALGIIVFVLGVNLETIDSFGPYMDIISIYIIPIGASIGAITWFYVLKKDMLLNEINLSSKNKYGNKWHKIGKFVYVPLAIVLTFLALIFKISF
ncbi:sodium-dependent transporter [Anaerococcus sp. Marseille-Q5996]|uniref:sodium-dependent transporter n=1 Tax=Anaerococcus sp. Marseille-Q5996 TaxID=2972769 RepID=UPI0021C999BC|nr:sodium-dependent transporter [Anaerococcus sp. Marseille-Q5996]